MSVQELITDHLDLWTGAVTHKNGSGRNASGKNRKIELTGIKKLRELILELAVRGKLVEQDPSDEPASVLLAKITEEKAQLVKEGKIKKPKKLPEIAEEEATTELPTTWSWSRLGEITNYGVTEKTEPGEVEATTWVLELEDIEKESSRLVQRVTYRERPFKSSKNRFQRCDVLYGKLRPYLDKVLVADRSGVCTTEIIPVRGFSGIIPSYLRLALKSPAFKIYANNSTHGMNLPRLGTDKARLALIPVPPTEEQHRIVEKVDELMALCDRLEQQVGDQLEAHKVLVDTLLDALTRSSDATELAENWSRVAEHFDTLFTTEASIDKLKKTILQLAVMGRLVEQDPNDEPASVLLDKIAEEKDRLVKEEKIKKPKNLPSIAKKDEPFNLPSGWSWARVGDILSIKHGFAFKSSHFCEKRTPYVLTTPGNFHEQGGFRDRLDRTKYYDGPVSDEFILSPRDMIIPMTEQAPGLLGSAAFVPNDDNTYLHNQRLGKLIIHSKLTTPGFIYWFFNSQLLRSELARTCTGTTVRHTSPEKVKSALVPVTSPEEQHRIVQKVDELMALCDQLKTRLSESGQTRSQLAETVVEQAVS